MSNGPINPKLLYVVTSTVSYTKLPTTFKKTSRKLVHRTVAEIGNNKGAHNVKTQAYIVLETSIDALSVADSAKALFIPTHDTT
jgi:hypothetical protein